MPTKTTPIQNHPPPGHVWLHIDRRNKRSPNKWALQFWENGTLLYRVAKSVSSIPTMTTLLLPSGQPWATLTTIGEVEHLTPFTYRIIKPSKLNPANTLQELSAGRHSGG